MMEKKNRSWEGGQYLFTLDWHGSEDSEEARDGGHKCAHVIALDNGNLPRSPTTAFSGFAQLS